MDDPWEIDCPKYFNFSTLKSEEDLEFEKDFKCAENYLKQNEDETEMDKSFVDAKSYFDNQQSKLQSQDDLVRTIENSEILDFDCPQYVDFNLECSNYAEIDNWFNIHRESINEKIPARVIKNRATKTVKRQKKRKTEMEELMRTLHEKALFVAKNIKTLETDKRAGKREREIEENEDSLEDIVKLKTFNDKSCIIEPERPSKRNRLENQKELEDLVKKFKELDPFKVKSINKKPFLPKKGARPLTEFVPFQFETEKRAQQWKKIEMKRKLKEEQQKILKEKRLAEEKEREEHKIRILRRKAEHKAAPIRRYKSIQIKPSDKALTEPISPRWTSVKKS